MILGPTPQELEERRMAFNDWLRDNGEKLGYYTLPPNRQSAVHGMLRKAFYAGNNLERRKHAPIITGGFQ